MATIGRTIQRREIGTAVPRVIKLHVVEARVFNPLHIGTTREDRMLRSHVKADAVAYHPRYVRTIYAMGCIESGLGS